MTLALLIPSRPRRTSKPKVIVVIPKGGAEGILTSEELSEDIEWVMEHEPSSSSSSSSPAEPRTSGFAEEGVEILLPESAAPTGPTTLTSP